MTPREELEALAQGAIDRATDRLAEDTEFAPFALAVVGPDDVVLVEAEETLPDEADAIALLVSSLREEAQRGRVRATALVTDVTLTDDDDELVSAAIRVELEHRDEDPLLCLAPYDLDDDAVEVDEVALQAGTARVFAPSPEPN
ncbi:MAG: hypothetical protein ACFCGT_25735 [Sandaracinaceae bacterium]